MKVDIPTAFHYFEPNDPADEKKGETRIDRRAGFDIEVDDTLGQLWIEKGIASPSKPKLPTTEEATAEHDRA